MADVLFYHLQNQSADHVLPQLLAKCLERRWNVVVQAASEERVRALDDVLWTFSADSFLPHGTARDPQPEGQPIFLTDDDTNSNAAQVRVLLDGAGGPDLAGYERALVIFDGADMDALNGERARWKTLKAAGHALTYWQQDDSGRWVKKA